jgi:spore maturation protein CgeB
MDDPEWARVAVYSSASEDHAARMLEQARGADLVVKASGIGVFDAFLEQAVLACQGPRTRVVFWDVDAPATLERVQSNPADPFAALIPRYDAILTYGGGDPVVRAYRALGARECVPIYNALDPSTHFRVAPDPRFTCDLCFLGNRLPDREARVEEFFIRAANLAPANHFVLGGSGWGDKRLPANVKYSGHVYTRDHNAFNSSALAVLNVNRQSMAQFGFSPPTRVFEAAGAAACLISDAWEGIELFLEPGVEVLLADDGERVARHLRSLTPAAARTIGERAQRRILAEHTYAKRALQLQELFGRRGMLARSLKDSRSSAIGFQAPRAQAT